MKTKFTIALTILLLLTQLSACQSIAYYSQSVVGHSKLMLARTSIDKAIAKAEPGIARKLELSKQLKSFAVASLALPNNNSYSSYVALKREYPVWVVVAAPKTSLEAKQWCYLVIGCAAYRGYFSKKAATRYAAKLERQGWDTHVSGASAYSTLGWFADPLLPSMMSGSDAAFAEVLFHELAHQRLYFNGQSDLNEAFASLVGEQGAQLWLQQNQVEDLPAYQSSLQAQRDFGALIDGLKVDLQQAYTSSDSEQQKEEQKHQLFAQFRNQYQVLKSGKWQGRGYYDRWLSRPLNNARLAGFSTYYALLPQLELLFAACGSDFKRLYKRLEENSDPYQTLAC